ncbi:hypothetical protein NEMBOFW57_010094 [Staphylotrichum longicolle]|uniref:CBF1-interacting co-repressor CIR N-terminal domain-containing protein n=1 Tax=Staphylotrichum longicolle TaxID=669026 RepID=A0AAD4HW04_9PEZI|nr:hypothetical protein NEMBOFW57_010094 [Staphylotrichum longicolle]
MPLHLLGKKSWNPYNPAAIARVRRDEAAAQAQEEAEEQRMQEVDAARRLAILRGEVPPPLEPPSEPHGPPTSRSHDRDPYGGGSRKRKRHGEDDTDFEMRLARERATLGAQATRELATAARPAPTITTAPASLVDSKGHISLFSEAETARPREGNKEATEEAARKERELKDQYKMRLVNAAGKDGQGLTDGGPWYASADGEASGALVPSKNVFGRDDPKRKVREAVRLGASDPLAMMKRGAKMVRELGKDRKREAEERERDLKALEREERREEKRRERRRRKEDDADRKDRGSSGVVRDSKTERRERSHRDHEDRRRSRSGERSRHGRERRQSLDRDGGSKARESSRPDDGDRSDQR